MSGNRCSKLLGKIIFGLSVLLVIGCGAPQEDGLPVGEVSESAGPAVSNGITSDGSEGSTPEFQLPPQIGTFMTLSPGA